MGANTTASPQIESPIYLAWGIIQNVGVFFLILFAALIAHEIANEFERRGAPKLFVNVATVVEYIIFLLDTVGFLLYLIKEFAERVIKAFK